MKITIYVRKNNLENLNVFIKGYDTIVTSESPIQWHSDKLDDEQYIEVQLSYDNYIKLLERD